MGDDGEPAGSRLARCAVLAAALLGLAIGAFLAATVPASPAMGWDESMHAWLPSARIVLALRAGEVSLASHVPLDCAQYPFAWPLVLSWVQLAAGLGEHASRVAGSLAWGATLLLVFLATRHAVRGLDERAQRPLCAAPWIALALGALCPLAAAFSGTLFLEVPSALATALALWTWQRRRLRPSAGRDLGAGAAIALALFTKWNYGLLLGVALAVDWLCEAAPAVRAGAWRPVLARARWLALPMLAACLWWFVWPLPGGLGTGAEHRASFASYLAGNLGATPASAADRVLYAATGFAPTVRLAALEVLLALVALRFALAPPVRTFVLAAGALLGAPLAHPFFLDRFLIPGCVPLFALAAIGCASLLPRAALARNAALGALALATLAFPGGDGGWLAARLGRLPAEAGPAREYVLGVLAQRSRLGPARRLPSGGLERAELDAFLDLAAAAVPPGARVGWLGVSPEISPAVLHAGLLERGGGASWFLERAHEQLDLTYFGTDPGFDDADLGAYAGRFDVILWTDPIDLRQRQDRRFLERYRARLLALGPFEVAELGVVSVARPLGPALAVRLYACRRKA